MKCFYDSTQDAIGTCKSCGKGISPEYAADLGKGLACKGRCEEDVRALISLIEHNISLRGASARIMRSANGTSVTTGLVNFFLGGSFIWFSVRDLDDIDPFLVTIGLIFVLWGVVTLWRSFAYRRSLSNVGNSDS
jgi:hypothetical protein